MWNINGFVPESLLRLRLPVLLACALGVAACGPSSGANATYTIVFTLSDSPEDLSLLTFKVDYTDGSFVGSGTGVSCELTNSDDDETAVFTDNDVSQLTVAIDATDNPLAPAIDIVECEFSTDNQPTAANFTITVVSATDDFDDPVNPDLVGVVTTSYDVVAASEAGVGEIADDQGTRE